MSSLALHQDTTQLSKKLDTAEKKINEYARLIASLYAEVKRHQDLICYSCKEKVLRANLATPSPEIRSGFTQSSSKPTSAASTIVSESISAPLGREETAATSGVQASAEPSQVIVSPSRIRDQTQTSQSALIHLAGNSRPYSSQSTSHNNLQTKVPILYPATTDSAPQQQGSYSDWSVEYNSEISQCLSLHVADTFTFPERVFCANFSRDGKYLAVGLENGETHIFDMVAGTKSILVERSTTVFYTEALETSSDIWSVQFSPNNKFIATGGSKGQINIWDIYQRRLRATFKHTDLVRSVDISPDGRLLVSASYDRSFCMWNIRDGSRRLSDGSTSFLSVRFSPDGQYVAAGNDHGSLSIWRVRNNRMLANYKIEGSGLVDLRSITFTPDGKRIASGGNMVHLWDTSSLTDMIKDDSKSELNRIWEFNGNEDFITAVSLSSDNRWLVASSYDHNVYILDARSGRWVCTLKGHLQRVWAADFSPAGSYLITGGRDHLLRVWRYEVVE